MQNPHKNLTWKIAVPLSALLVATFFVLNTAGFNSVLKLLGIKASDNEVISISSYTDFLGTTPNTEWLVEATRPVMNGTVVVESYSTLPNDPEMIGMLIPTYSSKSEEENIYKTHTYLSPVIDLKKSAPYLHSISAKYYEMCGTTMNLSYRMDDTWDSIALTNFTPLELTANSSFDNLQDRTALLAQEGKRYLQFQVIFEGITYDNRATVYELRIDTKRTASSLQLAELSTSTEAIDRNFKFNIPASVSTPTSVDILLLSASNQGKVPVHAVYNQTPLDLLSSGFNTLQPGGTYALVIKSKGYETQVIPVDLQAETTLTFELPPFEKVTSPTDYDLNGDGAINSIDLQVLLSKFGPLTP